MTQPSKLTARHGEDTAFLSYDSQPNTAEISPAFGFETEPCVKGLAWARSDLKVTLGTYIA